MLIGLGLLAFMIWEGRHLKLLREGRQRAALLSRAGHSACGFPTGWKGRRGKCRKKRKGQAGKSSRPRNTGLGCGLRHRSPVRTEAQTGGFYSSVKKSVIAQTQRTPPVNEHKEMPPK